MGKELEFLSNIVTYKICSFSQLILQFKNLQFIIYIDVTFVTKLVKEMSA